MAGWNKLLLIGQRIGNSIGERSCALVVGGIRVPNGPTGQVLEARPVSDWT